MSNGQVIGSNSESGGNDVGEVQLGFSKVLAITHKTNVGRVVG